jgi:hypothetical protein
MTATSLGRTVLIVGACLACAPAARAIDPIVTNFGIGTILHPLQEPAVAPVPAWCEGLPCHKDHVHIFAVNGLNPLCLGNFNGLCGYLRKQGFCNVYFGQLYTSHTFASRIRTIRQCDPEARIALIGFSSGANYAKWIANILARDCVKIDLLVYIVGDTLPNTPASHPPNVCRLLNIRGKGLILTGGDLFWNGSDIDGARNCRIECRHILAPSRRETLELLMDELLPLAYLPCAASEPVPPPPPPSSNLPQDKDD